MKTVLIIEDEDKIRSSLQQILELSHFSVLTAVDGHEGIATAKQRVPDLILCDVMMPVVNGYQVLQELRESSITASIPFVFLTAKADFLDVREGMNLGADDYLTKPVKSVDLLACIHARLNQHQLQCQHSQEQLITLSSNIARAIPHELNTPLNSIIGFADILSATPDPTVQALSQEILGAGERLLKTITKFVVYTELVELNIHPMRKKQVHNQACLFPVTSSIEIIANKIAESVNRQGDLQLKLQTGHLKMSLFFYEKLLEELIENAFKFSEPGDVVSVSNDWEHGFMRLLIQDGGYGMTPEQISAVAAYNQFERTFREQQGLGLGLVIAKHIAELQGGELTVNSHLGSSTTVCVQLPVQPHCD